LIVVIKMCRKRTDFDGVKAMIVDVIENIFEGAAVEAAGGEADGPRGHEVMGWGAG
jgi:hypothetical protein